MKLEKYKEMARIAHSGTSFSPEKRGQQMIEDYSAELEGDLASIPEEEREMYQARYENRFSAWLCAKSRCVSTMIAGPANFNVSEHLTRQCYRRKSRRAEKANRSEENRYQEFRKFRDRALSAIEKKQRLKDHPAEANPGVKPDEQMNFKGGHVIRSWADNRIRIFFDEKPDQEVINYLKKNGFKWAPSIGAWQRFNTPAGLEAVSRAIIFFRSINQ